MRIIQRGIPAIEGTMTFFCTFFDKRYLARGLALHHSLIAQGAPFHLWILCMDREVEDNLSARMLQDVTLVTVADLARSDPRVTTAQQNRTLVEFYFTSKACLCQYVFERRPDVAIVTYIDADGYFFGNPEIILREMNGYSVGLTGHRFPPRLRSGAQHGLFNAGFISFRRDVDGLAALAWWQDQCFEWCHDYIDNGRYADQGYLNIMPQRFNRVHIIKHKGINAAPWNISQYRITLSQDRVLIDDDPLIFYHFHGVKRLCASWYESGLSLYGASLGKHIKRQIYLPYIDELMRAGDPLPAYQPVIRIERGAYDWFLRLFPSVGKKLQTARKLMLGIVYRSMIRYRKPAVVRQ
jgi:hypothetical protein